MSNILFLDCFINKKALKKASFFLYYIFVLALALKKLNKVSILHMLLINTLGNINQMRKFGSISQKVNIQLLK